MNLLRVMLRIILGAAVVALLILIWHLAVYPFLGFLSKFIPIAFIVIVLVGVFHGVGSFLLSSKDETEDYE